MVRDDQPLDGFARERSVQQRVPDRAASLGRKASINHGPAIAIIKRIAIPARRLLDSVSS